MTQINLHDAYAIALERWNNPHPDFTSGFDKRTSDNALLVHMYGGLQHAADHEWLNAGRRLIDKTCISMLWTARSLPPIPATPAERISASLDSYVQETVQHHWDSLSELKTPERQGYATKTIIQCTHRLFGSTPNKHAANHLAFFLFPMLPIFCGNQTAVTKTDGPSHHTNLTVDQIYQNEKPKLDQLPKPNAIYGSNTEKALIEKCLLATDWWQRRVFEEIKIAGC